MTNTSTDGASVDAIHHATAIYTAVDEIDQLLRDLDWPKRGGKLLDPGCGNGNMIVRAVTKLAPAPGDMSAVARIKGFEFHPGSADEARSRFSQTLRETGWTIDDADEAARRCVETRDYLLDRPRERWDVILANPPYWRRANLPAAYRAAMDGVVPSHATGDLLHAYLDAMTRQVGPGGKLGLITSDRWVVNSGAAKLRAVMGDTLRVASVRRLDTASAFHRPKERSRDTPPRVHAIAVVLGDEGRSLGREPLAIEEIPVVEGVALGDVATIRLAPWLGPDGIFTVGEDSGLPDDKLVPCVEPTDICPKTGTIGATRRWAIVTGDNEPEPSVMRHLDLMLERMPARGRRSVRWLPPERFDRHLPLRTASIMIPRIATRLRVVDLPAGHLPTAHSLVVVSGMAPKALRRMLEDDRVQAQADAIALRIESGYKSYTATLLRRLVIPHDLLEEGRIAA